jgi:outer membrane biosynthesis protein TonB
MFDRYLSGSRGSWRRRAVLITSITLHVSAVIALFVMSVFRVTEISPPLLAVVFNPPPAQAPPETARPKRKRTTNPSHRLQPVRVPTVAPPTAPAPPPSEVGPGDRPDPTGPPDGPPGTDPNSHGTAPCVGAQCVTAPAAKPRNLPPHALDAERIGGAMPHLPAAVQAQRRGLGDTTFTARICVDQSGRVSSVSVLAGIPGADGEIVQTLRGWRYRPQPIPVCFMSHFVFDVQ